MNFFFGVKSSFLDSKLTIPRFQNSSLSSKNHFLFQFTIKSKRWHINQMVNIESNADFFTVAENYIDKDSFYCLATFDEAKKFTNNNGEKLIDLNSYTNTNPSYRANLQVSNLNGGFSSYQSEYPFSMTTKNGNILSPLGTLLNKNADNNIIFFKNIYELPIKEKFLIYFINYRSKQIIHKEEALSNSLNEIIVDRKLINPDIFMYTDKFIGVPIFCSITNNHISFEHTHPPHEYIISKNKFKIVSRLKKEFNEIIN
jgi:hypothetical protein